MSISYKDYCNYYANKCLICKGLFKNFKDGIWHVCNCQHIAGIKWKFDQVPVYPELLKYKTWDDFNGVSDFGKLKPSSFYLAKQNALKYCFNSSDPSVILDRRKHIYIHKHVIDGKNVVIHGNKGTGKSLVAVLILKEIIYASELLRKNLTFQWIKSTNIIDAARWSSYKDNNVKSIDFELLDLLKEVDFLFIDGITLSPSAGDHRQPPDMLSLNKLFSHRLSMKKPTILICSDDLFYLTKNQFAINEVKNQLGEDFLSMLLRPDNVLIGMEVGEGSEFEQS